MILSFILLAIQITTQSLPPATVGVPYSAQIQTDSPAILYLWQYEALPSNLGLNAESGLLTGMPTAPGTYNITVFAKDSGGAESAPKRFTLVIN